ncbi:hypothetical protein [Algoriphagus terrigena]|uniref:hypothetical protein n=1 Tax=Algoriphagus terrigena TaxID=344884 RepID=UPI00040FECC6|nr:hypothetical protein [Algoriphagus terrigena]
METVLEFLNLRIAPFAGIFFLFACDLNDGIPSPELGKYDLPQEVVSEIFTDEVLAITGSLEPFLDEIKSKGMTIHEGDNPPEIFDYCQSGPCPQIYSVDHSCLYDKYYPSYADSSFGGYLDSIFIARDQFDTYKSSLGYYSVANPNEKNPEYASGLDTGWGSGIASGDNGAFTLFIKIDNGKYDDVSYRALWIVSAVGEFDDGELYGLTNIRKCMILLSKQGDPAGQMANIGTIRIFEDDVPTRR